MAGSAERAREALAATRGSFAAKTRRRRAIPPRPTPAPAKQA